MNTLRYNVQVTPEFWEMIHRLQNHPDIQDLMIRALNNTTYGTAKVVCDEYTLVELDSWIKEVENPPKPYRKDNGLMYYPRPSLRLHIDDDPYDRYYSMGLVLEFVKNWGEERVGYDFYRHLAYDYEGSHELIY